MNTRYEALRCDVMDRDGRRCVLCNTEANLGFFAYPPEKVYSTSQTARRAWI
jgi:hypothetical protein